MDWLKYKKIYFSISLVMLAVGIFSLFAWKMNLGLDFTGGSLIEYSFDGDVSSENLTSEVESLGIEVNAVQKIGDNYLFRLAPVTADQHNSIKDHITSTFPGANELRFETVGPSIGSELIKKTFYAIAIATVLILLWVAYQFKSLKYGVAAILAMLHDTFILVCSFSLLGHFSNAEVDFLFVTAVLTTLSFSVHDTIVVFDRIREIGRSTPENIQEVANQALTETMVRSLNNSFTIIFMLAALLLLGGSTVKWFAAALLIGTVLGTYSSPFVAVPLLTTFHKFRTKS